MDVDLPEPRLFALSSSRTAGLQERLQERLEERLGTGCGGPSEFCTASYRLSIDPSWQHDRQTLFCVIHTDEYLINYIFVNNCFRQLHHTAGPVWAIKTKLVTILCMKITWDNISTPVSSATETHLNCDQRSFPEPKTCEMHNTSYINLHLIENTHKASKYEWWGFDMQ